jgi:hypothetical protein
LRAAFPVIELDGTTAPNEERHALAQSMPHHLLTASDASSPRSAPSVHRPGP